MANTATKQTNGLGTKKDIKKGENLPKEQAKTASRKETKSVSSSQSPIVDKIVKTEKPIIETPVKEVLKPAPVLSLEQKIEKVENLTILIEKREVLEESRKKLNAFVIGSPQFGENIKLTDENGNVFQTSNTEVFTKVIEVIKSTLIEKIAEIETEIQF